MIGGPALLGPVLAAFCGAAVLPVAYRRWPRATAWAAVGLAAALFCAYARYLPAVARGDAVTESFRWAPSIGVSLALVLDGLSFVFALLVTGIGALVLAYSVAYLGHGRKLARLLSLLLAFLGSMLGVVLADDAIAMFVFWELTSITSYFLIAFDDASATARGKAQQALIITSGGGLAMLVGLLLLADASASASLSSMADVDVRGHASYGAIVALIALGAFTKSAQVPFHVWLPGAMVAPTPVSAYLHSATMVNAGVYLLARLNPGLGGTALWTGLLAGVGAVTMATGAVLAVFQRDLKLTLAYSTIAVLGALTLAIGIGTSEALQGFAVFLIAHAIYKAALFLIAGNVDKHKGSRDPFHVGELAREMPVTAAAAVVAAASMAGLPPLLGFVAKESMLLGVVTGPAAVALGAAVLAGAIALVTAAWVAGVAPFFGAGERAGKRRDAPVAMLVGPVALAAAGLALGVAPGALVEPIAAPIVSAVAGHREAFELKLWHAPTGAHGVVLGLSATSLTAGTLAYVVLTRRPDVAYVVSRGLARVSPGRLYDAGLAGVQRVARSVTGAVQSGLLRRYIAITVLFAVAAAGVPAGCSVASDAIGAGVELRWYEAMLVAITAGGALAAAAARDRIAAIAALGASGFAISFLFALLSAPDLAITQLMVETLLVIILVLVFRGLPPAARRDQPARRLAPAALAGAAGALVAVLLVQVGSVTGFSPDAAAYYARVADDQHAHNVVNAILVNFRALDTLGEITVLAIAGLGVLALLRLRRRDGSE